MTELTECELEEKELEAAVYYCNSGLIDLNPPVDVLALATAL